MPASVLASANDNEKKRKKKRFSVELCRDMSVGRPALFFFIFFQVEFAHLKMPNASGCLDIRLLFIYSLVLQHTRINHILPIRYLQRAQANQS